MAEASENVGAAAQVAAEAAATVAGEIAAAENRGDAKLEAAADAIAEAEELQENIRIAALQTELGNRVLECERLVETWQEKITAAETTIAAQALALATMAEALTKAEAALLALSAQPSVLIPPQQLPTVIPGAEIQNPEMVDPTKGESAELIENAPKPEAPRRKRMV